jgi:hypothetical protein
MVGGKGVPKLIEEKILAMWTFGTFVAVFRDTLFAIEFGAMGNALDDVDEQAVGLSFGIWEDWL